jgi:hypothetical protein
MALRWTGAGLLEAQKTFRCLKAYRQRTSRKQVFSLSHKRTSGSFHADATYVGLGGWSAVR